MLQLVFTFTHLRNSKILLKNDKTISFLVTLRVIHLEQGTTYTGEYIIGRGHFFFRIVVPQGNHYHSTLLHSDEV